MIAKPQKKYKQLLSKTTIMGLRNMARHGSDAQLETFIRQVAVEYIAHRLDADVVDDERCLVVDKDTDYECECPYCHNMITLDLEAFLNGD